MKLYKTMVCVLALGAVATGPVLALEKGDILVRARLINVSPNDQSSNVFVPWLPGDLGGSRVSVSDAWTGEVDFTYMVTNNIGLELIAGTTSHDVDGNSVLGGVAPALGGKLFDTMVLPPTLTLQYHFNPMGKIRPYAGVGVNYTLFYDERVSKGAKAALGATKVELDDSWGLAGQVGVDFDVSENVFLNLDVKYIQMSTQATFKGHPSGNYKVNVDIDPWVFGVGIGTKF